MSTTGGHQTTESMDDAILRIIGFHRKNQCQRMHYLANANRAHDDLDTPTIMNIPTTITFNIPDEKAGPISGMGTLKFTPEIMREICGHLDVKSFLMLRQACRSAHMLTAKNIMFDRVVGQAANALVGIIRTGMWNHITLIDLYEAMCIPNCQICGKVGHFLYLPTVTRVCEQCLHSPGGGFQTVTVASFYTKAGITEKKISKSVPIVMGAFGKQYNGKPRSIKLVNFANAIRILHISPNLDVGDGTSELNTTRQKNARNMASVPLPLFDKATGESFEALSCKGCAIVYSVAAVRGCSMHTGNTSSDVLVAHSAFVRRWMAMAALDYLKKDFLEHVKTCGPAIMLWNASYGGRVSIDHLDTDFIKTGGLSLRKVDYMKLAREAENYRGSS